MSGSTRDFTFAWWNLHNFAHFDPSRVAAGRRGRWPHTAEEYADKRRRVRQSLDQLFSGEWPDLLAVCELTRPAAQALLAELPAGYELLLPPPDPAEDHFQVAAFYRGGSGVTGELPLLPAALGDVPAATRPMLVLHLTLPGHQVRFVACHWTGWAEDSSRLVRQRLADMLRANCHAYLAPAVAVPGRRPHVVVLGDLNEEPMSEVFAGPLEAYRDRASSRVRHPNDGHRRRVRLYNAAWRFTGEQVPHAGGHTPTVAGTYFGGPYQWRTFDHVLVSEGLVGPAPPFLDETRTRVAAADILVDDRGRPIAFEPGEARGVSDHLPVLGRLVLPEGS